MISAKKHMVVTGNVGHTIDVMPMLKLQTQLDLGQKEFSPQASGLFAHGGLSPADVQNISNSAGYLASGMAPIPVILASNLNNQSSASHNFNLLAASSVHSNPFNHSKHVNMHEAHLQQNPGLLRDQTSLQSLYS